MLLYYGTCVFRVYLPDIDHERLCGHGCRLRWRWSGSILRLTHVLQQPI